MHTAHIGRAGAAPAYYLLLVLVFSAIASAQDQTCSQLPLRQHDACMGLNEAAIIKKWPQYFRRSQPIPSERGDHSGFEQTLTIVPRSGNPIALL